MERVVEICCGSYYDCLQAEAGGAQRVELNSALYLGGLTPSLGNLILTKKHTNLKVIAMVRPRGGGFYYHEQEFASMLIDAECLLRHGADGIAFGCLDQNGDIAVDQVRQITAIIKKYEKEAVFHRAFDCVSDPYKAIEILIEAGIDRILTSGQQEKAIQGIELLKQLHILYGNRIELLAGSGIHADNANIIIENTGITQLHSSCKAWKYDPTTKHKNVSYAYADGIHEMEYDVVDAMLVKKLVDCIK